MQDVIEETIPWWSSQTFIVALTAALGGLCILATALLICTRHRGRKRQRRSSRTRLGHENNLYSDSAPPPSLDHITQLEPWMKEKVNLRSIADSPFEGEVLKAVKPSTSPVSSLAPSEAPSCKCNTSARGENRRQRDGSSGSNRSSDSRSNDVTLVKPDPPI